jgi:hypothetical protein
MHRRYASQGFAAVSVSVDNPKDPKDRALAEKFLREKQAAFLNVILDDNEEQWKTKLNVLGPPCVYVFNRNNQFVLKQSEEVDYKVIEKQVQELMGKQ